MSDFDKVAAEWDKNKMHHDRTEAIASKLLSHLKNYSLNKALEYGAGTGLLGFALAERFNNITLMDSSQEMVNAANAKIQESGKAHMKAVFFDLEKNTYTGPEFDIILNQMVLHHIENTDLIFEKFHRMLSPKGFLALADLYEEDGSFHGEGFNGHKGFNPELLKEKLLQTGFETVTYETCYTLRKEVNGGIQKDFPIFLLIARKL